MGSTIRDSIYTVSKFLLYGDVDDDEYKCSLYPSFTRLVYWIYGTLALIILLNSLIAFMGDAQNQIMEKKNANACKLKLQTINRMMDMFPKKKKEKILYETQFLYKLKLKSLKEDEDEENDEWEGQVKEI